MDGILVDVDVEVDEEAASKVRCSVMVAFFHQNIFVTNGVPPIRRYPYIRRYPDTRQSKSRGATGELIALINVD